MALNKEDQKYVIESASKALISFIPFFGGAIGSILSDALADRKEQRIKDAIVALENDLQQHKDLINKDFIENEDFLDVLEKTFRKLMDERSEQKRIAYKNILLTGIISPNTDYNSVEQQITIVDDLSEENLLFLKFLSDPAAYVDSVKKNITPINVSVMFDYLYALFPSWDRDFILDMFNDLENKRLITRLSKNLSIEYPIVTPAEFEGRLTPRGRKFIHYILR